MRLRRAVPAGLVDAGAASMATLAVGFYAARSLTVAELGIYAVFFTAFSLATVVPSQLVWVPVEVAVLDRPADARLAVLRRSIGLGAAPALALSVLASGASVLVVPGGVGRGVVLGLATTSVASSVLSPMQDHVRRMLHVATRSWAAAGVSVVQLVSALAAILVIDRAGARPEWVPFGALAIANLCSMATGFVLAARGTPEGPRSLDGRALRRSGRWLLLGGLTPAATGFLAAALVTHLSGAESLGRAEAARIVAQPLLVLSAGLSAVLGPRSMEAAVLRDRRRAAYVARVYVVALGLGGLAYMALTGPAWGWSPLADAIPAAYVDTGLVAVTVAANVFNGLVFPYRSELIAGRRHAALAGVELYGNAVRTASAAASGVLRAFSIPIGFLALGVARWAGYRRLRGPLYASSRPETTDSPPPGGVRGPASPSGEGGPQ